MQSETLHREPVHPSIDEGIIEMLVHAFYAKVRSDPEIGPIFTRVIRDSWDDHLAKMCDFWSSVMLRTGRYKGQPIVSHMRLKAIQPQHFARWLTLFRLTAEEVCPHEIAILFIGRAENIARSLQLGMFYRSDAKPAAPFIQDVRSR